MVRSNTIVGDRVHSRGMVVARIVRGNIPVENGVVHLIDKPLMIVARSLFEYIMEEGRDPANRLSKFAALIRDKGGLFAEALLEAKEGTLLAPSNEAMEKVDRERLDYLLGQDYLRAEMLGLHFVRERIISTDYKIQVPGDGTFSTPASLANNRIWFHFSDREQRMTVEGRGVNASVTEKDIGTINGVIHVIDRVLGVPYQTVGERINTDPDMRCVSQLKDGADQPPGIYLVHAAKPLSRISVVNTLVNFFPARHIIPPCPRRSGHVRACVLRDVCVLGGYKLTTGGCDGINKNNCLL